MNTSDLTLVNNLENYFAGINWSTSYSYVDDAAIFIVDGYSRTAFPRRLLPSCICLGPLNRNIISYLQPWERTKVFYLKKFLAWNPERGVNSLAMGYLNLRELIRTMESQARRVYNMGGGYQMGSEDFTWMLLHDSCFVLQLLLEEYVEESRMKKKYDKELENTIKSSSPWALPSIFTDMFLLENQLPLVVLRRILEFALHSDLIHDVRPSMGDLAYCFFRNFSLSSGVKKETVNYCISNGSFHHLLHLFCACIIPSTDDRRITVELQEQPHRPIFIFRGIDRPLPPFIPPARKLLWARVKLRKKTEAASFLDISFEGRTLEIPQLSITNETISLLQNLIAFERGYIGAGTNITAYVWLMRSIMQFESDVAILRQHEIIVTTIFEDKDVLGLFNEFFKHSTAVETIYQTCYLRPVAEAIVKDYKNKCNACLAWWINTWKERFLSSPWRCIGLMAAIGIFILTAIQTVCTVLDFVKGNNI